MKLLKAQFLTEDRLYEAFAIEHEGALWLVPAWRVSPNGKSMRPERMIRLDSVPHQRMEDGGSPDIFVNVTIPMSVVTGQASLKEEGALEVVEDPDITVPVPVPRH